MLQMIGVAVFEVFTIGLVIPFILVLTDLKHLKDNYYYKYYFEELITSDFVLVIFITVLFILAAITAGLLKMRLIFSQAKISHSIGNLISIQLLKDYLSSDYEKYCSTNSSQIISSVELKCNELVGKVIMPIFLSISSILIAISILLALLFINTEITVIIFIFFVSFYILIIYLFKGSLSKNSFIIDDLASKRVQIVKESVGNFREVFLNNGLGKCLKKFDKIDKNLRKAQCSNILIGHAPRYAIESIGMVVLATCVCVITVTNLMDSNQIIPLFGAFVLAAQKMIPTFQQIYSCIANIRGSADILKGSAKCLSPVRQKHFVSEVRNYSCTDNIRFVDLSFKYKNTKKYIFNNIDVTFPIGKKIAIIGKTGSGKSTILDILLGLLEPTNGHIMMDDKITKLHNSSWHDLICHVPQKVFLNDSSIEDNIVNNTKLTRMSVKQAAYIASLEDDIDNFQDGYETRVGEDGLKLSGGQRQRIGLARAVFRNKSIFIMDEATSAIDESTERKIFDNIYDNFTDATIILITHKLGSVENFDVILSLDDGKVEVIK